MDRIVRAVYLTVAAGLCWLTISAAHGAASAPANDVSPVVAEPAPLEATPRLMRLPAADGAADTPVTKEPAEMPVNENASPLRGAQPSRERSDQLEQVARQVDRQTRHGADLAGRGAYFAARAEFLSALKVLAEALDTEEKTDAHSRALTAALTAMKEAEDFLPGQSRLEANGSTSGIIAMHTTPVLKSERGNVTSMTALKCYLTYAQEQFASAVGDEVAGSMSLYALGKLHNTLAQKKSTLAAGAESKTMVFYQAAILALPGNFLAANDLGVLLAQCGNLAEARTILEHSLTLNQQSVTWHNLAMVYEQLGQSDLARRADQEAGVLQRVELARRKIATGSTNNSVMWIDEESFAKTSNNTPTSPAASSSTRLAGAPASQPSGVKQPAGSPTSTPRAPTSAERMSWGSRGYR